MCGRPGILLLAIFASILSLDHSALAGPASPASAEIPSRFDLPSGPMDKALRDFAVQANCNISYEPSLVAGLRAPAIKGEFTRSGALSLMLSGTKLRAVNVNEDTVQILQKPASTSLDSAATHKSNSPSGAGVVRVANAETDLQTSKGASPDAQAMNSEADDASTREKKDLEEITVTGTHIRGTSNSASPVQVYSRDDIDRSGLGTVKDFIQHLPGNFNGGASENTISTITGGGRFDNVVGGTGINLRGLGNDSTLVLINGHRVAAADDAGEFVDISMIPAAAIDRIEIVPDGASAIYGSDAVGGVVNFILRRDYEGAESRARFATVSDGGSRELQAAQTLGQTWRTGSALLSYEYYDRTPLSAADRSYTDMAAEPFTLLPEQVRHSAIVNLNQSINESLAVSADGTFMHRSTFFNIGTVSGNGFGLREAANISSYSGNVGALWTLPRGMRFEVNAGDSRSNADNNAYELGTVAGDQSFNTQVSSVDVKLDGPLWSLPAGPIRFALGAQYRRESFFDNQAEATTVDLSRHITAEFVEFRVPLVGPNAGAQGTNRLELSLAERSEHYSDFGSTNNPQVGMVWVPLESVKFRSTYGTSFKAPLLSDLNPVPKYPYAFPIFDPKTGSNTDTIYVFGGNSNLKPEKATTWTVGFDIHPLPGFQVSTTFYDIRIKDRIVDPSTNINLDDALRLEAVLGPSIVQRHPPLSLVQSLAALPGYYSDGIPLADITALVDSRLHNLSLVSTDGIDLSVAYKTSVAGGQFETGVDGTYILSFKDQFTATSPAVAILDTPYNPVNLRLRGRVMWTGGSLKAATFLNYVNSYTDNRSEQSASIASWTTADLTVGYQFDRRNGALDGTSLQIGVTNVTNAAPPFVKNLSTQYPINFDGANANALGRVYSIQLAKHW
jgi:iron complex outermembrane recepter protein